MSSIVGACRGRVRPAGRTARTEKSPLQQFRPLVRMRPHGGTDASCRAPSLIAPTPDGSAEGPPGAERRFAPRAALRGHHLPPGRPLPGAEAPPAPPAMAAAHPFRSPALAPRADPPVRGQPAPALISSGALRARLFLPPHSGYPPPHVPCASAICAADSKPPAGLFPGASSHRAPPVRNRALYRLFLDPLRRSLVAHAHRPPGSGDRQCSRQRSVQLHVPGRSVDE